MSDFLSELVARGRGPDTGLEPRIPSLFEPIAPRVFGTMAAEPQERAEPAPYPSAVAREGPRPLDRPSAQRTALSPVRAAPSAPQPSAVPSVVQADGAPARPAGSTAARAGPRAGEGGHSAVPVLAEVRGPLTPRPEARPGDRAPQAPPAEDQVLPSVRPRPQAPDALEPATGRRQAHAPEGVEPRAAHRVEVVATPQTHRPTMDGAAVAPAEQTVHVTIGRVEIRAVAAPTPAARPPEALQASSLDDYLAERNRRRQG